MSKSSKTFRLFVCSTFLDMKEERNALQTLVFPKLKKLCESRGYKFQPIDLRWGISEDASIDQRTVKICLKEIKRCKETKLKPYILVLLGSRYGWTALPDSITEENFIEITNNISKDTRKKIEYWYQKDTNIIPTNYILRKRHGEFIEYDKWEIEEKNIWNLIERAIKSQSDLKDFGLKNNISVIEHEITESIFNEPNLEDHALIFIREINGLQDKKDFFPFIDINEKGEFDFKKKKKLIKLKERLYKRIPDKINQYSSNWEMENIDYDYLKEFCENVFSVLTEIIFKQINKFEEQNEFKKEIDFHKRNVEKYSKNFICRLDAINNVLKYIYDKNNQPLIITGQEGVGKSALLAQIAQILREKDKKLEILIRFINQSSNSSNITNLLQGILYQLNLIFKFEADYQEGNIDRIKNIFINIIAEIPKDQLIIFIIDGLNHFSEIEISKWFELIRNLPENVRVITSFTNKSDLTQFSKLFPESSFLDLKPLTIEEGNQILDLWLKEENRTLIEKQRVEVLNNFSVSGLPLYLKLAFEHAKYWNSFTSVENYTLTSDISGLIESYFELLTTRSFHGLFLVQSVLTYLTKSRNGLMEQEMIELLSHNKNVMKEFRERSPHSPEVNNLPIVIWSRLYFDLEPFLTEKLIGDIKTLSLCNIRLKDVIDYKISLELKEQKIYDDLIEFFSAKPDFHIDEKNFVPNRRRAYELPYLLKAAQRWDKLEILLTNFSFISSKISAGMINDLLFDYNQITSAKYELVDEMNSNSDYGEENNKIFKYKAFIKENSHFLRKYPILIFQLALNYPKSSVIYKDAQDFISKNKFLDIFFTWLNKPLYIIPSSIVFNGHSTALKCCSWSLDKKKIVTGDLTGIVKIWNPFNGIELNSYTCQDDSITSCYWVEDNIVIFSSTKKIIQWNIVDNEINVLLKFVSDTILDFSLSPDKKKICISFEKSGAELWDIHTSKIAVELKNNYNKEAWSCSWMKNGTKFAVGFHNGEIRIFDSFSGDCISSFQAHNGPLVNCQWSHDGKYLASSSMAGHLKVWENGTFKLIQDIDCSSIILKLDWNSQGNYIAVNTIDDSACIYEVFTGKILAKMRGHFKICMTLKFSPDDELLLTASLDGTSRVWDVQENIYFFEKNNKLMNELSIYFIFFQDGKTFSKISPNGAIAIFDIKTLKKIQDIESPLLDLKIIDPNFLNIVIILATSYDCKFIATGSYSGQINIFNISDGKLFRKIQSHSSNIIALAWSPDNRQLISCSDNGILKIYDTSNGFELLKITSHEKMDKKIGHPGFKAAPSCCEWSPCGEYIAVGQIEGSCSIMDSKTGKIICKNHLHSNNIFTLSWSPDASRILSSDLNGVIKIWNSQTGQEIITCIAHRSGIYSVSWSPDGNYIFTGFEDGILMVWDSKTGSNIAIFPARGQISSIFTKNGGVELYLYDVSGILYILKINGLIMGIPIVTPVVFYNHYSKKWSEYPSIRCKICHKLFSLRDIGVTEDDFINKKSHSYKINCYHCNSKLILNPFIIDNREMKFKDYNVELTDVRSGNILSDLKRKIINRGKQSPSDEIQLYKSLDGLKLSFAPKFNPKKKESWYDKGLLLAQHQRYNEAIESLQGALKLDTKYIPAWNCLGFVYANIKKHKEAEKAFREVLKYEPKNSEVWYHLGIELYHQNLKEQAKSAFRTAVECDSKNANAWYNLGAMHREQGNLKESELLYYNALKSNPNDIKVLLELGRTFAEQNRLEEAEKKFKKVIELAPDNHFAWYELGITLEDLERAEEAEKAYRQSLNLNPKYPNSWNNLGLIFDKNGNFEEAEKAYRKALKYNPIAAYTWNNLGLLLKKLCRLEEAEKAFREAIRCDPKYTNAMVELGILLVEKNRLEEAEDIFENLIKIDPKDARSMGNLGYILEEQGRFKEAENMYKKSFDINPDDRLTLVSLGAHYFNQNDLESAEQYYQKAFQLDQNNIKLIRNMAMLFERTNRIHEAEEFYRKALQIDPSNFDTLKFMGNFFCRQTEFKKGEKVFQKLIDLYQSNAEAWELLGRVYKEQKQIEKAKKAFKEALRHDPESALILNNVGWFYYELKEYKIAQELLLKAVESNPNYEYAWDSLGSVYEVIGKNKEALNCYKKAVELQPTFKIAKENLERLLKRK